MLFRISYTLPSTPYKIGQITRSFEWASSVVNTYLLPVERELPNIQSTVCLRYGRKHPQHSTVGRDNRKSIHEVLETIIGAAGGVRSSRITVTALLAGLVLTSTLIFRGGAASDLTRSGHYSLMFNGSQDEVTSSEVTGISRYTYAISSKPKVKKPSDLMKI